MLIDKKVTKKIAFLARIGLSEKEEEEFSEDLSNMRQSLLPNLINDFIKNYSFEKYVKNRIDL